MNTTIEIDEKLIKEALRFVSVKNNNELFVVALQELINKYRNKSISNLKGRIEFAKNYNYKEMREGSAK